jgi:putative membrane protein
MYGPWYDHHWMFGGGMLLAWIWMGILILLPLLVLFALLKFLFSKRMHKTDREDKPDKTPIDILKSSYARGDISREEFLQKRDDLLEK